MKFIFMVLILSSALVHASPSFKHYYTGKDLLEMYGDSPDTLGLNGAAGIIVGVVETQDGIAFCLPKQITLFQLVDIIGTELKKYTLLHDLPAGRVVVGILAEEYPCK